MPEDKKFKEVERRVKNYVSEGIIKTKGSGEHVDFFLTNAGNSLKSAKALLDHTRKGDFNGSLWVINASYYSMFYTARALLENSGIKLKSNLSIHALTFDALVYFFYLNGKLEKKFFESFAEAQEEAAELLGKEKADQLIEEYLWEKSKRGMFTYETGNFAMQSKAQTSFERAKKFNEEIRAIVVGI